MNKPLTRLGNSEALVEIQGNAIVITPVQAAALPETLDRQAKFAAARERILGEYDELFRKLAEA